MQPAEIKKYFELYRQGLIPISEYNRLIAPDGKEFSPIPQTVQLPFFDSAEKTQKARLLNLLQDGLPHSTPEILQKVYGGEHNGLARVGARINDLAKEGYVFVDENGNECKEGHRGWSDKNNRSVYWYRLKEFKPKWYAK